jgi:thiol-disulfide isomerase/thioredoxin
MKGGKIRIITVNNSNISDINKLINNKNQNIIAKFTADWCGHCKHLNSNIMPEVEKEIKNCKGEGIFLNVPEPMISKFGGGDNIEGYPTIRFFVGGKKRKDYNGPRTTKALVKFIKKSLGKCRKTSKKKTKHKRKRKKGKTKKQKRRNRSAMRERFFKMISLK